MQIWFRCGKWNHLQCYYWGLKAVPCSRHEIPKTLFNSSRASVELWFNTKAKRVTSFLKKAFPLIVLLNTKSYISIFKSRYPLPLVLFGCCTVHILFYIFEKAFIKRKILTFMKSIFCMSFWYFFYLNNFRVSIFDFFKFSIKNGP